MYTEFFGFKERPFKLVPNPAYLFLGESHQEAMAHLVYALHQGEGFVEITGEVGTGKTTLCRSFLENLDESTEAAYIFNPNLDSIELLKAINDEFGISSAADTAKDLVDALNRFLMDGRASGKTILLVIDEAQNLSREVLEQIRLLSNLETTRNKLLQIILVGQPELQKNLDAYELRQLKQRVTLSLCLEPLTEAETREYVEHRLKIASGKQQTSFGKDALRMIYRYSQGIPRLINIACDRVLLTAYGLNQREITGKITRQAVRELQGKSPRNEFTPGRHRKLAFGLFAVFIICVAALFTAAALRDHPPWADPEKQVFAISEAVDKPPETKNQIPSSSLPAEKTTETAPRKNLSPKDEDLLLEEIIGAEQYPLSRTDAFRAALELWGLDVEMADATAQLKNDPQFFLLAARQSGLMLYQIENNLDLLKKLNLPAIMKFHAPPGGNERYLVLSRIKRGAFEFTFRNGEKNVTVRAASDDIDSLWTGEAFILWKNFFSINGKIPRDLPSESLITLKLLLRDIGYEGIELVPQYDATTRRAIMDIQQKHNLPVDGVVGPMTKIALYNEKRKIGIPFLNTGQ